MREQMDNVNYSEIVNRICKAGHPLQVVLFGSRSRGDAREDSNIDLLIIEESVYFWFVSISVFGLGGYIFRRLKPEFADVL